MSQTFPLGTAIPPNVLPNPGHCCVMLIAGLLSGCATANDFEKCGCSDARENVATIKTVIVIAILVPRLNTILTTIHPTMKYLHHIIL
jgi:hypothetical protein